MFAAAHVRRFQVRGWVDVRGVAELSGLRGEKEGLSGELAFRVAHVADFGGARNAHAEGHGAEVAGIFEFRIQKLVPLIGPPQGVGGRWR